MSDLMLKDYQMCPFPPIQELFTYLGPSTRGMKEDRKGMSSSQLIFDIKWFPHRPTELRGMTCYKIHKRVLGF